VGQCSSPYFRNDSGFKANVIPNTLNVRACAHMRVRARVHFLYVFVCHNVLDVSEYSKVVVLIGTRSGVLIENWSKFIEMNRLYTTYK